MRPLKLSPVVGILTVLAFTPLPTVGHAETSVPAVFGSGMVLQRELPIVVWGQDAPGTPVRVSVANREAAAKTDSDGRWRVTLEELRAEGPHVMTVRGSSTLRFDDVLVGEKVASLQGVVGVKIQVVVRRDRTGCSALGRDRVAAHRIDLGHHGNAAVRSRFRGRDRCSNSGSTASDENDVVANDFQWCLPPLGGSEHIISARSLERGYSEMALQSDSGSASQVAAAPSRVCPRMPLAFSAREQTPRT